MQHAALFWHRPLILLHPLPTFFSEGLACVLSCRWTWSAGGARPQDAEQVLIMATRAAGAGFAPSTGWTAWYARARLRSSRCDVGALSKYATTRVCCFMHFIRSARAGVFDKGELRGMQPDRIVWAAGRARSLLRDASDRRDGERLDLSCTHGPCLLSLLARNLLHLPPGNPYALLRCAWS